MRLTVSIMAIAIKLDQVYIDLTWPTPLLDLKLIFQISTASCIVVHVRLNEPYDANRKSSLLLPSSFVVARYSSLSSLVIAPHSLSRRTFFQQ